MYHWLGLDACPRMTAEQAALYEQERTQTEADRLGQATLIACLFSIAAAVMAVILLGDLAEASLMLGLWLALPLACLIYCLNKGRISPGARQNATVAAALAFNLGWCLMIAMSSNPAAIRYYYASAIIQMAITIALRARFATCLAASLACLMINLGVLPFVSGFEPASLLYHLSIWLPTMGLTLIATRQFEAERMRNFLQHYENGRLQAELARHNGELQRLAGTDPLTQIPNRRGLSLEIERLRTALPTGERACCTLMIVDIDHFKPFNDGYGHQAGDRCLIHVARLMRDTLPAHAHLSRFGGEEFLVLMPGCDREDARSQAERLRRAVRAEHIPHAYRSDRHDCLTISLGIACGAIDTDAALDRLVDAADKALYAAKAAGRNGWRLAEGDGERMAPAA